MFLVALRCAVGLSRLEGGFAKDEVARLAGVLRHEELLPQFDKLLVIHFALALQETLN